MPLGPLYKHLLSFSPLNATTPPAPEANQHNQATLIILLDVLRCLRTPQLFDLLGPTKPAECLTLHLLSGLLPPQNPTALS